MPNEQILVPMTQWFCPSKKKNLDPRWSEAPHTVKQTSGGSSSLKMGIVLIIRITIMH